MSILVFNYVVFIVDALIGLLALGYLGKRIYKLPPNVITIPMAIGAIGLIAQSYRCAEFIFTGHSPADNDSIMWVIKDLAIVVAIIYIYLMMRKK